jgi:hypothetical protein
LLLLQLCALSHLLLLQLLVQQKELLVGLLHRLPLSDRLLLLPDVGEHLLLVLFVQLLLLL